MSASWFANSPRCVFTLTRNIAAPAVVLFRRSSIASSKMSGRERKRHRLRCVCECMIQIMGRWHQTLFWDSHVIFASPLERVETIVRINERARDLPVYYITEITLIKPRFSFVFLSSRLDAVRAIPTLVSKVMLGISNPDSVVESDHFWVRLYSISTMCPSIRTSSPYSTWGRNWTVESWIGAYTVCMRDPSLSGAVNYEIHTFLPLTYEYSMYPRLFFFLSFFSLVLNPTPPKMKKFQCPTLVLI